MTDTFTERSLTVLNEALAPAQELLDTLQREGEETERSQEDVDAAATPLIEAIRALQGVDADSGAALAVVELAEAIVDGEAALAQADEYTEESVNALQAAVDNGKAVLGNADDPDTTQTEVDAAAE